ncbi:hypothetical protein ECC02_009232 [Trypanosoma cruzi]|uniref:ATPase n=1 Tax=Trypanosoma cruzi TaxID=5693 RepID=A0A7J6XUF4_TRYCR|nr:hypothetical protein ECC02_009232 [Trypanosoma cruzi]
MRLLGADCCRCFFCWDCGALRLREDCAASVWSTCALPCTGTQRPLGINFTAQRINFFFFFPCCLRATTLDVFSFTFVNCFFCTLPARGAVFFPPNCSTCTPTDTLMTTALCASPAARMRRGRDERRAEGAVTCGRATRACGAEHTFLSLLFCFLCGQGGQTPAAPHTHSHTLPLFYYIALRVCFSCRQFLRCRPREHFSPLR